MTEVAKAVERIRNFFAKRPEIRLATFSRRAGLYRNTLYGFHSAGWNPTRDTLEKCLLTIDAIEAEEARDRKPRPPRRAVRANVTDKIDEAA